MGVELCCGSIEKMLHLQRVCARLMSVFGHLEVILVLLISFSTMAVLMGRQHGLLSGKDQFTGKGRDLIDARYWSINHDGPWNTEEFIAWFELYTDEEKEEYIVHN